VARVTRAARLFSLTGHPLAREDRAAWLVLATLALAGASLTRSEGFIHVVARVLPLLLGLALERRSAAGAAV
jgi:hypothetical protein